MFGQDDLYAFHTRVFGAIGAPAHLIHTGGNSNDDRSLENTGGDDVDDLGYYPDGVKRTLTDEQIAMFRHSEIYSILRERQVLKENRQADGYELSDDQLSDSEKGIPAQVSSDKFAETLPDQTTKDQTTRYKGSKSETAGQRNTKGLISKTTGSNKRKRHSGDSGALQSQGHTFRRTARELDSLMADDRILDYGDDPSSTTESQTGVSDGFSMVSSASAVIEPISNASSVVRSPAVEGKKIWWPIVGT